MPEVAAVGAIAVRDGRLLLVKRGRPPAVGRWSVPGGRVEAGESEPDAVVREVAEETGLAVRVGALAGEVVRAGPGDVTYRIHDYYVQVLGGTELAGDDADDVAWVAFEKLAGYPLTDGLLEALQAWKVVG